MQTILKTQNEAYGFYGTMGCTGQESMAAWAIAMPLIIAATGCPDWAVRDFLDSKHGRHFADEVANQMASGLALDLAIRAAVGVHMGWRINRAASRQHGIPAGLPYLTGWVGYFEGLGEV